MRTVLAVAALLAVAAFLFPKFRGTTAVSGAPGAPAVTPVEMPAPAAMPATASQSAPARASDMTQSTLKTPKTVTALPLKAKSSAKAEPLAGAP